jgi:hypothetical protein
MGRKPGISRPERLFRAEIARALYAVIGEGRGAQSKAAARLGVSRQAMSLYLNRKATPSSAILGRAFAIWPQIKLNMEGIELNSSSFSSAGSQQSSPIQMLLFDAISDVDNQQLEVNILKKGPHSIDLKVSIDFENLRSRALI